MKTNATTRFAYSCCAKKSASSRKESSYVRYAEDDRQAEIQWRAACQESGLVYVSIRAMTDTECLERGVPVKA